MWASPLHGSMTSGVAGRGVNAWLTDYGVAWRAVAVDRLTGATMSRHDRIEFEWRQTVAKRYVTY